MFFVCCGVDSVERVYVQLARARVCASVLARSVQCVCVCVCVCVCCAHLGTFRRRCGTRSQQSVLPSQRPRPATQHVTASYSGRNTETLRKWTHHKEAVYTTWFFHKTNREHQTKSTTFPSATFCTGATCGMSRNNFHPPPLQSRPRRERLTRSDSPSTACWRAPGSRVASAAETRVTRRAQVASQRVRRKDRRLHVGVRNLNKSFMQRSSTHLVHVE